MHSSLIFKSARLILFLIMIIGGVSLSYAAEEVEIPVPAKINAPQFQILIDDISIDKVIDIYSISIDHELSKPSSAKIEIRSDKGQLPGKKYLFSGVDNNVEIKLGYNSDLQTEFTGRLITQEISGTLETPYILTIHCMNNHIGNSSTIGKTPKYNLSYASNVIEFNLKMNIDKSIDGSLSIAGINDLMPGDLVELDGFDQGFNKTVKIIKLTHRLDKSGWFTVLRIKQDE